MSNVEPIADFSPSKRFFVSMLTRDIELNDAILDLLDNCVDGALRTKKPDSDDLKPYEGFKAKLTITDDSFIIEDNCGGIPKSFREYAFKMGRPHKEDEENEGTVGVYGIGMKRAIFKIGSECIIESNHTDGAFSVNITPEWIKGEGWTIPLEESNYNEKINKGTRIEIKLLHENIKNKFRENTYLTDLHDQIKHSMSFIILKGFEIELNNKKIEANKISLMTDDSKVEPYIYKAAIDGVQVDLAVGFYSNLEDNPDEPTSRRRSEDAGWTIICNDRVVLYCDKTHLTGWGLGNVPRFHSQFINISGVVKFTSRNPEALPITTTKRGVDLSSPIYNNVRNKMIEGMLLFIRFTNQWKGEHLEEGKRLLAATKKLDTKDLFEIEPIKSQANSKTNWSNPNKNSNEWRYTPQLPVPVQHLTKAKIIFSRERADIALLSNYFFGDEHASPADVGMKCFDSFLSEVK